MKGELYVVGLGPGDPALMTEQARAALEKAEVLCGYTVYVDLVRDLYPDKEVYTTPMRGEMERCRWALQTADAGRTVAMVCSGDAGVYGMASPVLASRSSPASRPRWPGRRCWARRWGMISAVSLFPTC